MEQQGRILDGNLEMLGLQATLKMLALSGKTGVLTVTSGQERLALFLQKGHIIDLDEPGITAPDLIDMFRLLGRVPRAQMTELRRLAEQNVATALAIMVEWGIVSPAEVQQRIEFRVIQAVSRAVRWERGRFEFHREVTPINGRMQAQKPLNVDHVLLESLRLADEWGRGGTIQLSRTTVARWMPDVKAAVTQLGLGQEEIGVLCLSNGQFPLHAVAYALMIAEPQVAVIMQKLLSLGLIEVVDARLESELERSLTNLLAQSQHQLTQDTHTSPEQRMLLLIKTMGMCINGLLNHHAVFARALRGRGEVSRVEVTNYLHNTFGEQLRSLQRDFPRMEGIVRFAENQIQYGDLETLDRVVRGQELLDCYWDAMHLFSQFMRTIFERIVADEVGKSRAGHQYEDVWVVFLREIDDDIARLAQRRLVARTQGGARAARTQGTTGQPAYAYELGPNSQRRFN